MEPQNIPSRSPSEAGSEQQGHYIPLNFMAGKKKPQQIPISDNLHLHSIKATHVHLEESILPIDCWDTEIMDAA